MPRVIFSAHSIIPFLQFRVISTINIVILRSLSTMSACELLDFVQNIFLATLVFKAITGLILMLALNYQEAPVTHGDHGSDTDGEPE